MQFSPGKCPQCNGSLQLPTDRDVVKCMYCATDVVVRESIRLNLGNPETLLNLGKEAFEGNNYSQAHEYFGRVLEQLPNNVDAWIGKGQSAGWQSSLSKLRFDEMIQCYENALNHAQSEAIAELKRLDISLDVFLIGRAVFNMSLDHLFEFISVPQVFYDHIDRCQLIIGVLEYAYRLNPDLQEAPELIVDICNRMLKSGRLFGDEKEFFKNIRTKYDPSGKASIDSSSSCFVVTATLGYPDHFVTQILRVFRDRILAETQLGLAFIRWYYKNGPLLAAVIRPSRLLRLISFALIVLPAFVVAVPILAIQIILRNIATRSLRKQSANIRRDSQQ